MTYDEWKTTDPADRWLGSDPDAELAEARAEIERLCAVARRQCRARIADYEALAAVVRGLERGFAECDEERAKKGGDHA